MALTRGFKQTVIERIERDPEFAKTLLDEAATLRLSGKREYSLAIDTLNELLDAGGADEKHPLALQVHHVGEAIAAYEACHHPLTD
jgi:hypothetical protein